MSFQYWVTNELTKLLGIDKDSAADISSYLSSFEEKSELVSFIKELLTGNEDISEANLDTKQKEFLQSLIAKWERQCVPENVIVYKKSSEEEEKKLKDVPKFSKSRSNPFDMSQMDKTLANDLGKKARKKTNYVSLYGQDGELQTKAVMLPGRYTCECQAQKHKLINNCLKCGRVGCEQEGSGPCLFCGNLVCTKEEKTILARKSHKSEKLYKQLMSVPGGDIEKDEEASHVSSALAKARAYKDRLLNYDRTCAQRTKVIDDESDYFSSDNNIWLSEKEREIVKRRQARLWEMKHGSRLNKKVTLDFAGRRVVEEDGSNYNSMEDHEILDAVSDRNQSLNLDEDFNFNLVNPSIKGPKPVYVSDTQEKLPKLNGAWSNTSNRLQDYQLLEMSDPGMCLSMHQPWASLLVCGIKKHEGRSWYSKHRGRLWIAAASRKPTDDEIREVEQQHEISWKRQSSPGEQMPQFPTEYPVSCLLGCVRVTDILEQDEYRELYPTGESSSPYVFVCTDPMQLTLKLPVTGKHKIWRLDPNDHKTARRALRM